MEHLSLNDYTEEITDASFVESNATNPADAGFLRAGDTETASWRNNADDDDHSIGFNTDIFQLMINSTLEYSFSATLFDLKGNALINFDYLRP